MFVLIHERLFKTVTALVRFRGSATNRTIRATSIRSFFRKVAASGEVYRVAICGGSNLAYAAPVSISIGSTIEGSSFSGLLTRVDNSGYALATIP
jgi:hypothetical protein